MKPVDNKVTNLNIVINNARISQFYDKPFMVFINRLSVNVKFKITKFLITAFAVLSVLIKI
jgi:hypothetical protein